MYTYDEVLEIAERFMIGSGIRRFCTDVCRGGCCGRCNVGTCFDGARKLECSLFVCGDPIGHDDKTTRLLWKVQALRDAVSSATRKIHPKYREYYYEVPDVIVDELVIPKDKVDKALPEKAMNLIAERVEHVISKRYA